MEFKKKILFISVIILLLLITIFSSTMAIYYYSKYKNNNKSNDDELVLASVEDETEEVVEDAIVTIKVEIKGEVVSPGVYEVEDGLIINDLINISGGLTSNAYTNNINLSKKLKDEMVVMIYNKDTYLSKFNSNEISEDCTTLDESIEDCLDDGASVIETTDELTSTNSTTININTASLEELTTLPGIGESKAQSIITYREEHGKFTTIEDIMNVSGIGEATFEKFKSLITVQ